MLSPWLSDYFIISRTFQANQATIKNSFQNNLLLTETAIDTKFLLTYVNMLQEILITFDQYFRNKFSFYLFAFFKKFISSLIFYIPLLIFIFVSYADLFYFEIIFHKWYELFNVEHFEQIRVSSRRHLTRQYDIYILLDIYQEQYMLVKSQFNILVLGFLYDIEEFMLSFFVIFKKIFIFLKLANFKLLLGAIKSTIGFILFRIKYLFWFVFGIFRRLGVKYKYWQFTDEWKLKKYDEKRVYRRFSYWNEHHTFYDMLTFKFIFSMQYNLIQIAIFFGAFFYILYEFGIYLKTVALEEDEHSQLPKGEEVGAREAAEDLYDEIVNPKKSNK
jgi:hypothetical protein